MKTKAILVVLLLAALSGAAAFGESFRLGASVGAELLNRPTYESLRQEFDEGANLLSGLYWEVLMGHLGLGMSYLVDFQNLASPYPELDYLWFVDWVGSFDLRYHFVKEPFSVANGLLTQSFKVKRQAVMKKYRSDIERLYREERPLTMPTET